MVKNYFRIALRNLTRNRLSSAINIGGLAIGMACCMLILIYISDELSYNTFFSHYGSIYRVNFVKHGDGETRVMAGSTNAVGPAIEKDVPEAAVEQTLAESGDEPYEISIASDKASVAVRKVWVGVMTNRCG